MMRSLTIFQALTISTVSVISSSSVDGASFRDVGDLLKVACSSKYSSSGVQLRWMILLSSLGILPQTMVAAMKHMECDYEVRTIESLPDWDFSDQLPYIDYKVIAIGPTIEDLRQAFKVYTPLKHHVDVWCTWLFRSMEQFGSSIEIDFDIACCQGLLFAEWEDGSIDEHISLMGFSRDVGAYHFRVELLEDFISICCECGIVRKKEDVPRLLQPNELSLRWTYVPRDPHLTAFGKPGKTMRYRGNDFLLLKDICDQLNTSYELTVQPEHAYGSFNATVEQWVGMVGDVWNKEMDFAISDIACTFPRTAATDCYHVYFIDVITFISRRPLEKNAMYTMAWTFDIWGWSLILLSLVAASITAHLVSSQNPATRKRNPDYLLMVAVFLKQTHDGYEEIPTASYRILLINWAVFCFLLGNSFSGCTLAFMNVRLYDAGVNNMLALQNALRRKTYTGGTIRDSSVTEMIDEPMGNKVFALLKAQTQRRPELLVVDLREGIMRSARKRYAYIDSRNALLSATSELHLSDKLAPADDFFTISLTTIHGQKKCFLKPTIDLILTRVRAGGLFSKYLQDALGRSSRSTSHIHSKVRVLRLKDFGPHFIILALGSVASLSCFVLRYFCRRTRSKTESNLRLTRLSPAFHPTELLVVDKHGKIRIQSGEKLRFNGLGERRPQHYRAHEFPPTRRKIFHIDAT